ncbi:hypothetical protein AtEden1_Chr2g0247371 [Arabidopsis thaliana]
MEDIVNDICSNGGTRKSIEYILGYAKVIFEYVHIKCYFLLNEQLMIQLFSLKLFLCNQNIFQYMQKKNGCWYSYFARLVMGVV